MLPVSVNFVTFTYGLDVGCGSTKGTPTKCRSPVKKSCRPAVPPKSTVPMLSVWSPTRLPLGVMVPPADAWCGTLKLPRSPREKRIAKSLLSSVKLELDGDQMYSEPPVILLSGGISVLVRECC